MFSVLMLSTMAFLSMGLLHLMIARVVHKNGDNNYEDDIFNEEFKAQLRANGCDLIVDNNFKRPRSRRQSYDVSPHSHTYPHVRNHTVCLGNMLLYISQALEVQITNQECFLLQKAVKRFLDTLSAWQNMKITKLQRQKRNVSFEKQFLSDKTNLQSLELDLRKPCDEYPHPDMDESYQLIVSARSILSSDSVWGIMHGLETMSQLFYIHEPTSQIVINSQKIKDHPLYPHRGLMLDTVSNYVSVGNILRHLDAMAMNKMNVFHWRIVGDLSFPYKSSVYPELSDNGSYDNTTKVYTESQIRHIIEYARERGIRVYPEFNIPGHVRSWAKSHPELVAQCTKDKETKFGPLDPLQENTYRFLQSLFQEAQTIFRDKYFHIGGDSVDYKCWSTIPKIRHFALGNKLTMEKLQGMFMEKVTSLLEKNTTVVVMQEVFDTGFIAKDSVIQVSNSLWEYVLVNIIVKNHKAILTALWNIVDRDDMFWTMYSNAEPRETVSKLVKEKHLRNIIGGEVSVWTGKITNDIVFSSTWPQAMAVAELLWSGREVHSAGARAQEQVMRMRQRGLLVDWLPSQPDDPVANGDA